VETGRPFKEQLALRAVACTPNEHSVPALMAVACGAVLLVFSVWWWYFEHPSEKGLRMERGTAFFWGYGHYFVFASVAALGTGFELAAGSTHGGAGTANVITAGLCVTVPLAVYLMVTAVLQGRLDGMQVGRLLFVGGVAAVVLLLGAAAEALGIGVSVVLMGVVVVCLIVVDELFHPGHSAGRPRLDSSDAR